VFVSLPLDGRLFSKNTLGLSFPPF
jgi:hypothetical protein